VTTGPEIEKQKEREFFTVQPMSAKPAEQHLIEIERNRTAMQRNPLLKQSYGDF
jgi:hypothetical protein